MIHVNAPAPWQLARKRPAGLPLLERLPLAGRDSRGVARLHVSTPASRPGAYTILTAFASAASARTPDVLLADGDEVFVVTVSSPVPFASADLSGGISGLHSFNIDTIVFAPATARAPAPGTLFLFALAVPLLAARCRGRRV